MVPVTPTLIADSRNYWRVFSRQALAMIRVPLYKVRSLMRKRWRIFTFLVSTTAVRSYARRFYSAGITMKDVRQDVG